MKLHNDHVLIIADTHVPFEHKNYLDFCVDIRNRVKCKVVIHIGDLVDNHAINYHEHDPNGRSPIDEMAEADKHLKKWFKAFPSLFLCRGNHDCLVDRKGRTVGLPERAFKQFRDIWQLPDTWKDDFSVEVDGSLNMNLENKYYEIKVKNPDGEEMLITSHWDADANDWADLFKTIMKWVGFMDETIKDTFYNEEIYNETAENEAI